MNHDSLVKCEARVNAVVMKFNKTLDIISELVNLYVDSCPEVKSIAIELKVYLEKTNKTMK